MRSLIGGVKDLPFGHVDRSHPDQAIANVAQHLLVVGINEMCEQSLLVLADKVGWEGYPCYDRMNTNRRKSAVSEADIEIIRQCHTHDMELYE